MLNGHEHHYERFAPQDADGRPTASGIRQFIAGCMTGPIGMDELAVERSAIEQELIDREARRVTAFGVAGGQLVVP